MIGGFKLGFRRFQRRDDLNMGKQPHHHICKPESPFAHMGGDELRYCTLSEMDMKICRRVNRDGHRNGGSVKEK